MKATLQKIICIVSILTGTTLAGIAQTGISYTLTSPDKKIELTVEVGEGITWQVNHKETQVLLPSALSMTLSTGEKLGKNARISKSTQHFIDNSFETPFYKKSRVTDQYNQLLLRFRGNYTLEFRAYNDGVAYRFLTHRKGELTITNEESNFLFNADHKAFVPYVNDMRGDERYSYSFESFYDEIHISEMAVDSLAIVPLLVDLGNGKKAVILESNVENYPGMFLTVNPDQPNSIQAVFAPYPLEGEIGGYNMLNFIATKRADYIAKTKGDRTYPWRAMVISEQDGQLANNDMVQKLAAPCRIQDISWIKPGKSAWDWWHNYNLRGVDFKAGINTESYKYTIDFAAANQIEYIIIDWGWSTTTLMESIPEVNIPGLVEYGKQKNVDIILWASWELIHKEKEQVFPYYAQMGVKGFKVDFFDSDDQHMIDIVYDMAQAAADHQLILNLHGMKATGIQRTYPNILNFEGVKGLENFKWAPILNGQIRDDHPRYDVTIPYIRMMAGPLDYTPGAMRNATCAIYRTINDNPMSQGTRVHQLAMYIVYEAPFEMMADSPTDYIREQECTDFITRIPTVFDETIVLDGEIAEYIMLARRKGREWYVGAMTNWTEREKTIDFSFLGEGTYEAEIFRDGINADRDATDYQKEVVRITANDTQTIQMYSGGGWTARITPVD